MFDKKIWIPICLLVILISIGLFYGHHISQQEPVKVYKFVTPDAPPPSREPAPSAALDFQAIYQGLREQYPDQTKNPPPFENVPVDLWNFAATKIAFMENFNFYIEHYDPKGGGSHTPELRIAAANMENIDNAAEPTFGLFTIEQCEEIKTMYWRYFEFKSGRVNHDRVWKLVHEDGYRVLEAIKISRKQRPDRQPHASVKVLEAPKISSEEGSNQ